MSHEGIDDRVQLVGGEVTDLPDVTAILVLVGQIANDAAVSFLAADLLWALANLAHSPEVLAPWFVCRLGADDRFSITTEGAQIAYLGVAVVVPLLF
jgi:predicted glycosyltransferase